MQAIHKRLFSGDNSVNLIMTLFRAEKQAANTYAELLKSVHQAPFPGDLLAALHCHQRRADQLAGEVRRLGGQPLVVVSEPFVETISSLSAHDVLLIFSKIEDAVSERYLQLMGSHDFTVQLLARRLFPQQEITAAKVFSMVKNIGEIAA